MASPLAQFQGVNASTDQQKAALGQMIAQQGSAGVDSYKAQQKVALAAIAPARQSVIGSNPGIGHPAMASAVGPGELTQQLAARAAAPAALGARQAGQAATEFGGYTGFLGQANANYMDAVKGAAPIVASQTAGTIAGINADAAARRQSAQQSADDAASARDWQKIQHDWSVQDRMLSLADDAKARQEAAAKAAAQDQTYYDASKAGKALGWNNKTINGITTSTSYNQVLPFVIGALQKLGPGAGPAEARGIIETAMNTKDAVSGKTPAEVPGLRTLLMAQLRGLFGQGLQTKSHMFDKP